MAFENKIDTMTIATTDKGEQYRIIRNYKRYTEGHGKNINYAFSFR